MYSFPTTSYIYFKIYLMRVFMVEYRQFQLVPPTFMFTR